MTDNQAKLTITVDEGKLSFEIEGEETAALLGLAYGIVRASAATQIALPRLFEILNSTALDLIETIKVRKPEEHEINREEEKK